MLESSSNGRVRPSTTSAEQSNKLGTVVRALWPDKPALNLAQRAQCSERGAQYVIDGQRKASARVLIAIMRELV